MMGRKTTDDAVGGDAGRVPDEPLPAEDPELDDDIEDRSDTEFDPGWEDGDPADRRRDPLRRP